MSGFVINHLNQTGNTHESKPHLLDLTDADHVEIDAALSTLETKLASLIDLHIDERRSLPKMGDKSGAFCRQTLAVLTQNPQVVPASLDLAEAQRDLANLDALRGDVMSAALEGYALLKVLGKDSGLDALRQSISARFVRSNRVMKAAHAQ